MTTARIVNSDLAREPLILRPCNFVYPPEYDSRWGCVATNGKLHVYVEDVMHDDWQDEPLEFLRNALKADNQNFRDTVQQAWTDKRSLLLGEQEFAPWEYGPVLWGKFCPEEKLPQARVIPLLLSGHLK